MYPLKTQRDYALLSQIHLCCDNALFGGHFWPKFVGKGHKNIFKDWGVIFQNCQFEVRKGFEVKGSGDALKTSRLCHIEILLLWYNPQSTLIVRCEVHVFLPEASIGQIRAFVANLMMSRQGAFLVLFGLRLYSDKRGLIQILLRYLNKKLAVKAPANDVVENWTISWYSLSWPTCTG